MDDGGSANLSDALTVAFLLGGTNELTRSEREDSNIYISHENTQKILLSFLVLCPSNPML